MNARVLSTAIRQVRPSAGPLAPRALLQQRFASSQKQPSNVAQFYKTFTRPVAKVLLLAIFTYQLAYWGWVKLEQDETRVDREAEMVALESAVAWMSGDDSLKSRTLDTWRRQGIDPTTLRLETLATLARQPPAERQRTVEEFTQLVYTKVRDLSMSSSSKSAGSSSSSKEPSLEESQAQYAELEKRYEQELQRLRDAEARELSQSSSSQLAQSAGHKGSWWKIW
ncbi:hypothetical protein BD289DRAFT_485684 [Coniella lustricola]|uniref:Uncharacterized protein n=1 Tax=Coniella lustricola TaxID=2025994 RepID=A0A2T2ZXR9_9PEZI|nr:hypothetical protein BD289DRAFT_485684 [Coniella lustricola]